MLVAIGNVIYHHKLSIKYDSFPPSNSPPIFSISSSIKFLMPSFDLLNLHIPNVIIVHQQQFFL